MYKKILALVVFGGIIGTVESGAITQESDAWSSFVEEYGEGWIVHWNERTGTPHRILGKAIPLPEVLRIVRQV
jgi:hypothetical protein